jgi:hypothetical protein
MELLAIAGIIGYGLYNSQEGREPRQDRNRYADILGSGNGVRDDYDTKPTDMVRKYRKKAEKRWKQAQVPKESGIITPNMRPSEVMPYFTSGKTMNTNTDYKQRKMELFTGDVLEGTSVSGTYKHKREADTMFGMTPQGRVSSGGTVGNAPGDAELQKARSISARTHNNVLPAEQIRVGPGLGVGPEVAATGGFQQFYRQMPLNINEYKLNTLPGGVVSGGTTMGGKGEIQQISSINHNPGALVIPYDERPPLATPNGAIVGRTEYGKQPRGCAGLRPFEDYAGPSDSIVEAQQARYLDKTRGRPRTGEGDTTPMINASGTSGQYSGVGGYTTEGPESFTLQTQRGLVNKYLMPAGPNGGVQAAGEARPEFVPEATLRESYESVYYTGGAGTTVGPAERLDVVELQPESRMPAKMAGQSRGYTPGAGPTGGATNVFLPESMGAYGLIDKNKYDGFSHTLPTPLAQTFGSIATEGKTPQFGTKSAVENPYSSPNALNIASGQLSQNRFNRDIAKPDALAATTSDAGRPFAQQNLKPRAWSPDVTPLWKK